MLIPFLLSKSIYVRTNHEEAMRHALLQLPRALLELLERTAETVRGGSVISDN